MKRMFILLACAGVLLFPSVSFAQSVRDEVVILADVNLSNAKIVKNDGATLVVSLDIENRASSTQPDIRYGIELVRTTDKGQEKVDTFVADETVSLVGNESVHRELSYSIPSFLSGDFEVWTIARTTGGLMLGLNNAGKVTFSSSGDRVTVVPGSCNLSVSGDDEFYSLLQGVDIVSDETLTLSCQVKNESTSTLSLVPYFDTFRRSVYGEQVNMIYRTPQDITLNPGETKSIFLDIPKAPDPQAYDISVALAKKGTRIPVSEKIVAHYVLRGESATIQNISLDKSSYVKGDAITATVFAISSADGSPGSRAGESTGVPGLAATLSIVDSNGRECIKPQTNALESDVVQSIFSATALIDCDGPIASVVLADADGKVLDSRTTSSSAVPEVVNVLESAGSGDSISPKTLAIGIAIVLFLGSLVLIAWKRFGKGISVVSKALVLAFILSSSLFIGTGEAEAVTFRGYAGYSEFTVNLNKTSFAPGETAAISTSAHSLSADTSDFLVRKQVSGGGYETIFSRNGVSGQTTVRGSHTFTVAKGGNGTETYGINVDGSTTSYFDDGRPTRSDIGNAKLTYTIVFPDGNSDTGDDSVVNGACGSAAGIPATSAPIARRCSAGISSSVTTNASSYDWTCYGDNGGTDAPCSAPKAERLTLCYQDGVVAPNSVSLVLNETKHLTAHYGTNGNCSDEDVTSEAIWSEDTGSSVVSLSGSNPVTVTAGAIGSESVSATYSGYSDMVTCTVVSNEVPEEPAPNPVNQNSTNWREVAPGE